MQELATFAQQYGLPAAVALLLGVLLYRRLDATIADLTLDLKAERRINDERAEKTIEAVGAVKELTGAVREQGPVINEVLREVRDLRAVLRDTRPDYRPRHDRAEER